MATAFSYSTSVVRFRYPIQKATANPVLAHFQKTTANPVLVHATIELLKPLHITRIGVRALHNGFRSEIDFNGRKWECHPHRVGSYREKLTCEGKILNFLKSNKGANNLTTNHAKYLSKMLIHIGEHAEENGGLVTLYKDILEPAHISTMWEIAGYNHTDEAADMLADMLAHENRSPVKWGGKSRTIAQGIVGLKRKRSDEDSQKPFRTEGEWEMELHRCVNREAYNVVFKDKSTVFAQLFSGKKEGLVFVEKNPNSIPAGVKPSDLAFVFVFDGEKKGQVSVAKNLNGIPAGVKPSDLPFVFPAGVKPSLPFVFGAYGRWPSSNRFVIYMRAAGPKVLIGQAWTENSKRPWATVILVKRESEEEPKVLIGQAWTENSKRPWATVILVKRESEEEHKMCTT